MRFKRFFDLVLLLIAAPLLMPVLVALIFLVKWKIGKPVFFQQIRTGYDGELFKIIKFRTMTDARGSDGQLLPDDDRLMPFGCWLRSTSLDELPTLWNVVKGDMSLIGPRPLLPEYLPLYSPRQARRHEVRPGVTGWAQVNGRNSVSWEEKFELDIWYVDNFNILLDVRILFRTFRKVLTRDGISGSDTATMQPFKGID